MGVFNFIKAEQKRLMDQVDVEALKPDSSAITALKKKITHAGTVANDKYLARKRELSEEKAAVSSQASNRVKFDVGFEGFITSIKSFLTEKYHKRPIEEIEEEEKLLEQWASEYFTTFINDIIPNLKEVRDTQQKKINFIQDSLETASNTEEVDELFVIIVGEYHDLLNRLDWYVPFQKTRAFSKSNFIICRTTLAEKRHIAAEKAVSEAEYYRKLANFHAGGEFE